MSDLDDVRRDLLVEQHSLDAVMTSLSDEQWFLDTPSIGWSVADQIGHLSFFDHTAALAIRDPEQFKVSTRELFEGAVARGADEYMLSGFRAMTPAAQLNTWRTNRGELEEASATLANDARVAWYGPSMGATSFLTARLMEVWAHGTDIIDALGLTREPSDRLRHIAQLGFITRKWSYVVRGEEPLAGDVRLELVSPSDQLWTWGPEVASDTVRGTAEDFCLVVTQRRHLDDTSLETGELARHWLLRAQAFAGAPTNGPVERKK